MSTRSCIALALLLCGSNVLQSQQPSDPNSGPARLLVMGQAAVGGYGVSTVGVGILARVTGPVALSATLGTRRYSERVMEGAIGTLVPTKLPLHFWLRAGVRHETASTLGGSARTAPLLEIGTLLFGGPWHVLVGGQKAWTHRDPEFVLALAYELW